MPPAISPHNARNARKSLPQHPTLLFPACDVCTYKYLPCHRTATLQNCQFHHIWHIKISQSPHFNPFTSDTRQPQQQKALADYTKQPYYGDKLDVKHISTPLSSVSNSASKGRTLSQSRGMKRRVWSDIEGRCNRKDESGSQKRNVTTHQEPMGTKRQKYPASHQLRVHEWARIRAWAINCVCLYAYSRPLSSQQYRFVAYVCNSYILVNVSELHTAHSIESRDRNAAQSSGKSSETHLHAVCRSKRASTVLLYQ